MGRRFAPTVLVGLILSTTLGVSTGARSDQVGALVKALGSSSVAARADAVEELAKEAQAKNGKVKCRPAYGPLLTTLSDPVESVRKQATRALASLSSRSDVPALIGLLSSPDWRKREAGA